MDSRGFVRRGDDSTPPPRRRLRAGRATDNQQGTLPYMGGSLPYNRHTSAVLRPVKALVRRASAERGVQPRRRSARVRRDRGHGSRGSLFWRCS